MYLELKGKRGQGDIYEQREIIRALNANPLTKLCIIAEPCGSYGIQDDTAVPLDLDYKLVHLFNQVNMNPYPLNVENEMMVPIAEQLFSMKGLVVPNLLGIGSRLNNILQKVLKDYYFNCVDADAKEKIHLIHILPSE